MSKRIPINEVLLEESRQKAEVLLNDLLSSGPTQIAAGLTQLCPREEDWEKLFVPHIIPECREYYNQLFRTDFVRQPEINKTELDMNVAQAEHFWERNPISDVFPSGFRLIAQLLQPGSIWIEWQFRVPGTKYGTSYNGLAYLPEEGRFVWTPHPYKTLKAYKRDLEKEKEEAKQRKEEARWNALSKEEQMAELFVPLERRIKKLGGERLYLPKNRLLFGEDDYKKELLEIETQENLYQQLYSAFGVPLPERIQRNISYPIRQVQVDAYLKEKNFDKVWRNSFVEMKNQLPIQLVQTLPQLPTRIQEKDVAELIPIYRAVQEKNTFLLRIKQWIRWRLLGRYRTESDWNTLLTITPYIAKIIIRAKSEDKLFYLNSYDALFLHSLDPATAKVLAQWGGLIFRLSRINRLSAEIAQELAQWKGECLYLNGIHSLDLETAQALAQWKGRELFLNGIQSLDPKTAQALAQWKKSWGGKFLSLNGIQSLDPKTAQALAQWKGNRLFLNGIQSLDPKTAQALAQFKGEFLFLKGIHSLDLETAQALAQLNLSSLDFPCIQSLAPETAQALAQFKGRELSLNGIHSLDLETAQALAQWKAKTIFLEGLHSLDAETAQALAQWKGNSLYLNGIQSLDLETAQALAQWKGRELFLNGIQSLDPDIAEVIYSGYHSCYMSLEKT